MDLRSQLAARDCDVVSTHERTAALQTHLGEERRRRVRYAEFVRADVDQDLLVAVKFLFCFVFVLFCFCLFFWHHPTSEQRGAQRRVFLRSAPRSGAPRERLALRRRPPRQRLNESPTIPSRCLSPLAACLLHSRQSSLPLVCVHQMCGRQWRARSRRHASRRVARRRASSSRPRPRARPRTTSATSTIRKNIEGRGLMVSSCLLE